MPAPRSGGQLIALEGRFDVARQLADAAPVAHAFGGGSELYPGGGASVPAGRIERVAGCLTVVGEERRALVEPVRVRALDRRRDPLVRARPPFGEQGPVGHILRQRVLEHISEAGGGLVRDDHLCPGQHRHRFGQMALGEIGDFAQQRPGYLRADDRHRLHERLLAYGQSIDARCESGLDRRGQDEAVELGRQPVFPAGCPRGGRSRPGPGRSPQRRRGCRHCAIRSAPAVRPGRGPRRAARSAGHSSFRHPVGRGSAGRAARRLSRRPRTRGGM